MPDGVEHHPHVTEPQAPLLVILPLMPDGVEHDLATKKSALAAGVILPLMPDGVEHLTGIAIAFGALV